MNYMEAFIFAANLLYVATYFTERLLRIRIMTLCAGCCLIVYHVFRQDPLLTIIGWNVFFVGLNVVQILRLCGRGDQTDDQWADQQVAPPAAAGG